MESRKELKEQAVKLLGQLNKKKLKRAINLLQILESDGQLLVHSFDGTVSDQCYTNIPNECLKITEDHLKIGPRKKYITSPILNKVTATYIFDDFIVNKGTKLNPKDLEKWGCVLKNNDQVLIRGGDRVVYEDYIFWVEYLGSIVRLYITKDDYEKYHEDYENYDEDLAEERYEKCFIIAASLVHKIVLIEELEYELKEFREKCEADRNCYTSSGE